MYVPLFIVDDVPPLEELVLNPCPTVEYDLIVEPYDPFAFVGFTVKVVLPAIFALFNWLLAVKLMSTVGTTLDGTFKVIVLLDSEIHVEPFIVWTLIVAVPLVAFGI